MKLYVIPTPIGNLEDITLRAIRILGEVDYIVAEDTRTSSVLLKHIGVSKPMSSFHKFNEHGTVNAIVARMLAGERVALISDAGTPAISDPGYLLVRHAIDSGIEVECLPGATAFVPALVDSGLPCDKFVFEGFLPVKKGRQTLLSRLASEERTMIFYESPHRLVKSLKQLSEYFGAERQCSVSRELSKKFEQTVRGSLTQVAEHFTQTEPRGEIVVIVRGKDSKEAKADKKAVDRGCSSAEVSD